MQRTSFLALVFAFLTGFAQAQFLPSRDNPQTATVLGSVALTGARPDAPVPVTDSVGTPVGTLDPDGTVRLILDALAFPKGSWHSLDSWHALLSRDCDTRNLQVTRNTRYALVTSFKAGAVSFAARMALTGRAGGNIEETQFVYAEGDGHMVGTVTCGSTLISYNLHFKAGWNQMLRESPGPVQNLVKHPQWLMQPRTTPVLFSLN